MCLYMLVREGPSKFVQFQGLPAAILSVYFMLLRTFQVG